MATSAAGRLLKNARREAVVVAIAWLAAVTWTLAYCYLRGFDHAPDAWVVKMGWAVSPRIAEFRQIAGFPDWVFYGILCPWMVCSVFTVVFGLFGMADDDLGAEGDEGGAGHGH